MQHIHTLLHKVKEHVGMGDTMAVKLDISPETTQRVREMAVSMLNKTVPHYVINTDLIEAFVRQDLKASIKAVFEANIARLTYPEVLVEFSIDKSIRRFVWVREEIGGGVSCFPMGFADGVLVVGNDWGKISYDVGKNAITTDFSHDYGLAHSSVMAWLMAVLLVHTRGVEKETIAPIKLNRTRIANGRVVIPTHTYLRIGVVYDREGRGTTVINGDVKKLPRRVHMRCGHVRNQAFGKDWNEHRLIYIEPVLVNYSDGEEYVPLPKIVSMK